MSIELTDFGGLEIFSNTITGNFTVTGSLTVGTIVYTASVVATGDIDPSVDLTYSLGDVTHRWIIPSPRIDGTVSTTGLTMPAFSMGDNDISGIRYLISYDSTHTRITRDTGKGWAIETANLANNAPVARMVQSGGATLATTTWLATTQVGLTLGGNMTVGAYSLVTTNLLIKEGTSSQFYIRNSVDNAYASLVFQNAAIYGAIQLFTSTTYIDFGVADDNYITIQARDNGVGQVEIARGQGAADPYFSMGGNQQVRVTNAGIFLSTVNLNFNTSVDSAAVADQVSLGGYEISAGHRALAISSEEVVVEEIDETKFSHKLPVRINGATYNIMLTAT